MLIKRDKDKIEIKLPTKKEVDEMLKDYKSDIKLTKGLRFEDEAFSEELQKFTLNSVYISDGFEMSQYKDKDKFFVRLTSTKNSNTSMSEGLVNPHFIELEFNTYEDFLLFCENVYTRNGIKQTDGLVVESELNSKSFFKGAATATTVVGGLFLLSKLFKSKK